jgi:hypothetical protein
MVLSPLIPGASAEEPDYRYFDLSGTHAQAGHTLGTHDPPFATQPWWAPPALLPFTRECAAVVRSLHAPLLDEFGAYAEAQSWHVDALWQQSCRVNLKARFRMGGEGCSSFAWRTGGRMVVGRNYDYWPTQARRQRIRFLPSTGRASDAGSPGMHSYASLGARGGVPCGRYDGLNQHGLFVSLHVVMTDTPDDVRPGVPFHLVGRMALELCATAREAVELLTYIPHLSSLNYLLADRHEACVIEADPRRARVLPMEADVIAATNHYRHPDMRPLQGNRVLTNSARRLSRLECAPQSAPQTAPAHIMADVDGLLAHARQVMADRSVPMCGVNGGLTTLWSCVAELTTGRIQYAPGAPCQTPYQEMPHL